MRTMSAASIEAISQRILHPVRFVELEFDEGPLRLWTGLGYINWDGKIWSGGGTLLKIEPAAETQALEAQGARLQLSGVPELVAMALVNKPRGNPCRIWRGFMNPEALPTYDVGTDSILLADELVQWPIREFTGRMDRMPITSDPANPVIQLTAENHLVMLNRAEERRYTHEDQQIDYPGDRFFEFVPQMQDAEIEWGD